MDGLRRITADVTRSLETEKPRTLAFLGYVDTGGANVTFVHAFADAESMDLHLEGAEGRSIAAYEFLEPDGWEIYGAPSDAALGMMRRAAETTGVKLSTQPGYLDGFLRLAPSQSVVPDRPAGIRGLDAHGYARPSSDPPRGTRA